MADSGNVRHLDTNKFSSTIEAFKSGIEEYNRIKDGVRSTTYDLFIAWHGEGKTQFERDYNLIYRQLSDIGDIMYELYDALIDAQAAYIKADEEAAKLISTQ